MDAVIGLGSNLGDSVALLRSARSSLSGHGDVVSSSGLYHGRPIGGPGQPDYYNAAVRVRFHGSPVELLRVAQGIELELGRVRSERWGPRTIDLDLLWIRGQSVSVSGLQVPHCRLHLRRFALLPLVEVVPDACEPGTEIPYGKVLDRLVAPEVTLLARHW